MAEEDLISANIGQFRVVFVELGLHGKVLTLGVDSGHVRIWLVIELLFVKNRL